MYKTHAIFRQKWKKKVLVIHRSIRYLGFDNELRFWDITISWSLPVLHSLLILIILNNVILAEFSIKSQKELILFPIYMHMMTKKQHNISVCQNKRLFINLTNVF